MSQRRVLVTGGAGFIGSAVCERFAAAGHAVRVLDDWSTGRREHCAPEWECIEGDVADRAVVAAAVAGCDAVAHLAAFVSVPLSFDRRDECERINVEGTRSVIAACEKHAVRKLVFASSCSVYADDGATTKSESQTPRPANPYAESKLAGEALLGASELPTAALRFFNVYGPRQNAGSGYAAAVPNFIQAALSGDPLTIYGDGQQSRDFIYVADVAEAVFQAAQREANGVFNVGTGTATRIAPLAETIASLVGEGADVRYEAARVGDVRAVHADVAHISAALDWRATQPLEAGLAETLNWWRSQSS